MLEVRVLKMRGRVRRREERECECRRWDLIREM